VQIRNLLPIVILLLVVAIIVGLILSTQFVMMPGMERMEGAYAYTNLERGMKAVENDATNLGLFVSDWASWDDTYQFIEDENFRYIESNLVDETFTGSNINFILYLDTEGNIIYFKGVDFKEEEEEIEVPEQMVKELVNLRIAGHPETIMNKTQGLLALPESPVLVAAAPILRSNDSGPARGTLVMGRYFDHDEVLRISDQIGTEISLYPLSSPYIFEGLRITDAVNTSDLRLVAISDDARSISALSTINDVGGHPAYIMRLNMSRDAFQLGIESIFIFLVLVVVIGGVSFLVIMLVVRKRFISRLEDLNNQIERIGKEQDFSGEVSLKGNDELVTLSRSFNGMLRSLKDHIADQRQAEQRARIATEKLHLLTSITRHDILNQITVIMGHTDLVLDRIDEGYPIHSHVEQIERAVGNITDLISFTRDYEKLGMNTPEWQNISNLVQNVMDKIDAHNLFVDITTGSLEIFADPLLERVFYNLFDNTLRHARTATQVSVSFYSSDGHGTIVYEDNGTGVPQDMKEMIFEKGVGNNTGFGLFLSREILSITGISIHENGVPGSGVKFVLHIPDCGYRFAKSGMDTQQE